tara:strand:- start:19169 stop:19873 length:705 start_codon:yes stop_codon:yes gene_type:complete
MKKIVSIHQPHLFPWLNYFNKIAKADVFVVLDDVQFRRRYFQNRAKIKAGDSEKLITIPLKKHPQSTLIKDIQIEKSKEYENILKTIESFYKKCPYFNDYFLDIASFFQKEYTSLSELNIDLLKYFLKILNIETEIHISSKLTVDEIDPNKRLLKICQLFGAENYIAGMGGKNYMHIDLFQNNDIEILWQNYDNGSISYPQLGKEFVPGLSIIDVLFNVGAEKTRELIFREWKN